ncbi:MAG: hypothetical protein KJO53_04870, partial [Eudoraea sp.]|nr:hypothetical protein [Eudoraea sp.]
GQRYKCPYKNEQNDKVYNLASGAVIKLVHIGGVFKDLPGKNLFHNSTMLKLNLIMGMVLGKQYIPLNCKGGAKWQGVSIKIKVPGQA